MIPKATQHHSFRGGAAATIIIASGIAVILGGCASPPVTRSSAPLREVTPRDFARLPGSAVASPMNATQSTARDNKVYAITMFDPDDLASEIAIEAGAPNLSESAGPSREFGGPVLVDAKVGEINGMPIFASTFLESLEPRLVAMAANEGLSLPQWRQQADGLIADKLVGLISDELLKAEALADIGPERKNQLSLWEDYLRERELSRHYGSATIAENDLGQSLDETVQNQLDRELIGMSLRRDLRSVQPTWHDIQLAYEQQHERFNPPPRAKFHVIKVRDGDTKNAELITSKLDAGEAFEDVAKLPENAYQNPVLAFHDVEIKGEYLQAALFSSAARNDAAHTLKVGDWTGPIVEGQGVFFLKLLQIDDKAVSLYDAQPTIAQEILEQRLREARFQRIQDLKADLTTENEDRIVEQLLNIAEQRFYPRPN